VRPSLPVLALGAFTAFLAVSAGSSPAAPPARGPAPAPARLAGPRPLAVEHEELHERLAEALAAGGETAKAARALVDVLHPHFVREEQIALPPLSLLPRLARGEVSEDMRPALEMAKTLERELPRMLEEHEAIKAGFRRISDAAEREGHVRVSRAARRLVTHAEIEEAVLYPATLLVGRVLEEKLPKAR
jgi:hypothetical protein